MEPEPENTGETALSRSLLNLIGGFQLSQALYVVAKLDVCTHLDEGPLTVGELAERAGVQPGPLSRVIRVLTPAGLFRTVDGRVTTTTSGALLSRRHPRTLANVAEMMMETHYEPFGELLHTVRTGEPGVERRYGLPFFTWMSEQPGRAGQFARAMSDLSGTTRQTVFGTYELPAGRVVADIGGADGSVLAGLFTGQNDREGIVFDLPAMVPVAERAMAERGLDDRVRVLGGDFFENVPVADIYVLGFILHDWNDDEAAHILGTVRRSARKGARLLIIESIVPTDDEPHLSKAIDLTMLVMSSGRERTADEYRALIRAAGFTVDRIVPTPGPFSVIEATADSRETSS